VRASKTRTSRLAVEAGLDFVLGNPEKNLHLLDKEDRFVVGVADALAAGRRVTARRRRTPASDRQ
jgi:hypothetical protein